MYSYLHFFAIFGVTLIPYTQGSRSYLECERDVLESWLIIYELDLHVIQTFNNIDTDVLKTSVK